jgi:hypothetical protein
MFLIKTLPNDSTYENNLDKIKHLLSKNRESIINNKIKKLIKQNISIIHSRKYVYISFIQDVMEIQIIFQIGKQ